MKKLYTILLAVLLAAMLGVGIWSLVDTDPTGSVSEKRTFQKPQFSVQALLDGTYIPALETYYSDTFPGRETLLEVNRTLNRFYYYSGSGESGVLLVNQTNSAAQGGERLDTVQQQNQPDAQEPDQTPEQNTPASDETPAQQTPEQTLDETPDTRPETPDEPPAPETDPELNAPDESEASYAGAVVVVGGIAGAQGEAGAALGVQRHVFGPDRLIASGALALERPAEGRIGMPGEA